jgi:hypothetical protein
VLCTCSGSFRGYSEGPRCGTDWQDEDGGWLVLDSRADGWFIAVCPDCQTDEERARVLLLLLDP